MSSLYTRLKITLGKTDADKTALDALQPDDSINVNLEPDIELIPAGPPPRKGIILYPGGRCASESYAPVMRALASTGWICVIARMPLRLAVLNIERANSIMDRHPQVTHWVIGGHSMGGAMAAAFANRHPDAISALFFLASYPAQTHALPDSELPMAMIYGTHDTITRKSEFKMSYQRLPEHTDFLAIEGGDHYQFGCFSNAVVTATISRDEQQRQVVAHMLDFLENTAKTKAS